MTAWATIRRAGTGASLSLMLFAFPAFVWGDEPPRPQPKPSPDASSQPESKPEPPPVKLTPKELREAAEKAEKAGDWDSAFTIYCHLFVADRGSADIREKLNVALRRAQQLRRHRDPQFQQFAVSMPVSDAMKLFGEVLTKVPVFYVERERATPQILWEHGVEELARALGDPVFRQAFLDGIAVEKIDVFRTSLRSSWAKQTVTNANDAKILLRKLTVAAQDSFTVRVPSALIIEVVCGSCSGLDEYTVFLNPTQLNPDSASAIPDLTAQGVYLGFADGGLIIEGVAPGSWAAFHTTLRKGDRITRLNGHAMDMMATLASTAEALRTPIEGFHEIELALLPADSPPIRLPVIVPTVYGDGMVSGKEGIAYARLGSFAASTPRELDDAINRLKVRGARVLVLDLRGNMGGSFVAGVETAKRLIPAGLIVTTQGQLGQVNNQPFSSDSGMTAHDIPVVVLVDAETASAAEVLAIALQEHNRATLVGMPTFGKGAIQYPLRLDSLDEKDPDGKPRTIKTGGVRLTIAKLISPRGNSINGVGITPDIMEADPTRQLQIGLDKASEMMPMTSRPMPVSPPVPTIP
jgi:carboxyl-terminal processing protease